VVIHTNVLAAKLPESCGQTQSGSRRRVAGLSPPLRHETSGARLQQGAKQGRPREVERGSESMDLRLTDRRVANLRLGPEARTRILPRPEDGFRAVMEQAPRAEAVAARWVEQTRPAWTWLAREWRRLGIALAVLLIGGVEMQALQTEVDRLQKENQQFAERIKQLKSDPSAIEKEAREQLHYTRKGEIVFVSPAVQPKPPVGRAKNSN
jgi:cell division protein FtsB